MASRFPAGTFQVKLGGEWKDYSHQEDKILKRAYMAGFPNVKFHLKGHGSLCQNYIYDFRKMVQLNKDTGKERAIRQPLTPAGPTTAARKWKAPSKPLVPAGPTTVVNVPPGSAGKTIQVPHPRVKGAFISVRVPASAKPGQAMLVPLPAAAAVTAAGTPAPAIQRSSAVAAPAAKLSVAPSEASDGGWTTGGKVAAVTAAGVGVFGVAVGGAILGDHIEEHGLDATLEAAGDGIVDAGEATGDFFVDAGEFVVDAAEDVGDFVMDLF